MYILLMLALSIGMLAAEIREFFYKLENNELAYLLFKISLTICLSEVLSLLMILNRYVKHFEKSLKSVNEKLDFYEKLFNITDKGTDSSDFPDFNPETVKMIRGRNTINSETIEFSQETSKNHRKNQTPVEDEDPDYIPEKPRRGRSVKKYLHLHK